MTSRATVLLVIAAGAAISIVGIRELTAQGNVGVGASLEVFDEPCVARLANEILIQRTAARAARTVSVGPSLSRGTHTAPTLGGGGWTTPNWTQLAVTYGSPAQSHAGPPWVFCGPFARAGAAGQECIAVSEDEAKLEAAASALALARIEAARDDKCISTISGATAAATQMAASRALLQDMSSTLRAIRDRLPPPTVVVGGVAPAVPNPNVAVVPTGPEGPNP